MRILHFYLYNYIKNILKEKCLLNGQMCQTSFKNWWYEIIYDMFDTGKR